MFFITKAESAFSYCFPFQAEVEYCHFLEKRSRNMGLFGASKKEKQLQSEIERLNELLAPEHNDIAVLQNKIRLL